MVIAMGHSMSMASTTEGPGVDWLFVQAVSRNKVVHLDENTCLKRDGCWGCAIIGAGAAGGAWAGTGAGGGGGGGAAALAGGGAEALGGEADRPRRGMLNSACKYGVDQVSDVSSFVPSFVPTSDVSRNYQAILRIMTKSSDDLLLWVTVPKPYESWTLMHATKAKLKTCLLKWGLAFCNIPLCK